MMARRRIERFHRAADSSGTVVGIAIVATVTIVIAGVVAQVARPLAPDLGAVPDPARWFSPSLLDRIASYRVPLRRVAIVAQVIDVLVPVLVAANPAGRRLVVRVVAVVGAARPVRSGAAVVAVVVAATALAHAPLDVWAYRHAWAFGLSTRTPAGWLADWGLARGVELAVAVLLAMAGYRLLSRWPRHWWVAAAPAGVVVVAASVLVAPLVIEPLWFDLSPLPDGRLRRELETVLVADGRPDAPLLVADASRRTVMQNAYVSGLWGTRRIVLYDTLLERPPPQVAQVLAHELAHERNRDLPRGVLAGGAGWVVAVGILGAVLRWRVRTGRQRHAGDPHGAAAAMAVVAILMLATTPVTAWSSRRAEAAADLGALRLTGDPGTFCDMQRGLVERNLSDPAPPTWQRLWSWSHPPAASRLELARRRSPAPTPGCAPPAPTDRGPTR